MKQTENQGATQQESLQKESPPLRTELTSANADTIGRLLLATAPPARDPFFRIRILERRERQRYKTRTVTLCTTALLCIAGLVMTTINATGVNAAMVTLVLGASLAGACWFYAPAFTHLVGGRSTTLKKS